MLNLIRQILKGPRAKPYRITVIESAVFEECFYGPELALIMGYGYCDAVHGPAPQSFPKMLVISRKADYRAFPKIDGLTVRVDDVCDLRIIKDRNIVVRQLMLALKGDA
jgi:hypothetical protein